MDELEHITRVVPFDHLLVMLGVLDALDAAGLRQVLGEFENLKR